jgi:UDP-N-acetylmuramyl pentapeptide phosphotransferase/UDP-N-acetylglucosamine-1-phosphate transferase
MDPHRPPPVLDMTPEGEFRDTAPRPRAGTLDRILGRVGGVAILVALVAGGLLLASLAVVFVGLILPVLLVAGAVGAVSIWWRLRRARKRGTVPFTVIRR